jgi:methyltransferase-like protein/ubiquinone/menaquinone biosynthesis C-methylase UbiE
MTDAAATPYDAVFYPGLAYDYTHPDRLATIASLHGFDGAPAPRCRVLELGCGAGSNIIPMAFQYPDSEFIGIDLSDSTIAKGNGEIAGLGLKNVTLRCADIMQIDAAYGQFDYIIAHGVYSWVPPPVREKVLAIFRDNLAPRGVAYVSYNSYPGSHLRNLTRDMMLHHIGAIGDPQERVAQARGILKFLAEASSKDSVYGTVLRDQFARVEKMRDEVLFHDDLLEGSSSFLLREVVEGAGRYGLQYLSDATFARTDLQHHSDDVVAVLDRLCGDDIVARHQYQDFIEGHGFRRTLLCHHELALQRSVDPQCVKRYRLSTSARPVTADVDPAAPGIASFSTQTGATISTDHQLSKAAILHLGDCWPQCVGFPELLQGALRRLGAAASELRLDEEEARLAGLLFRAASGGHVGLHLSPPPLTVTVSERPEASLLARKQALAGPVVTNQQHRTVLLEHEIVRHFLQLVDGTRTVDDLVTDLRHALNTAGTRETDGNAGPDPVTRESVEQNLALLMRMALLVG